MEWLLNRTAADKLFVWQRPHSWHAAEARRKGHSWKESLKTYASTSPLVDMAKRRKHKNCSNWTKLGSGRRAVNSVAARVAGEGVKKKKHEQLLEKAKRTKDKIVRASIMAEARAAQKSYESRLVDKAAENRARKALIKAQWLAQERKW